jgi:putative flippase GtrA
VGVDTLLITKITDAPLFRFILVGAVAFGLDAAIVWAMTRIGVNAYGARAVSLCLSVAFTFLFNRALTFQARQPFTWTEVVAYVSASGLGMAINYGIYVLALKLGAMWLLAMVVGTGLASLFNFYAYGRIFAKKA